MQTSFSLDKINEEIKIESFHSVFAKENAVKRKIAVENLQTNKIAKNAFNYTQLSKVSSAIEGKFGDNLETFSHLSELEWKEKLLKIHPLKGNLSKILDKVNWKKANYFASPKNVEESRSQENSSGESSKKDKDMCSGHTVKSCESKNISVKDDLVTDDSKTDQPTDVPDETNPPKTVITITFKNSQNNEIENIEDQTEKYNDFETLPAEDLNYVDEPEKKCSAKYLTSNGTEKNCSHLKIFNSDSKNNDINNLEYKDLNKKTEFNDQKYPQPKHSNPKNVTDDEPKSTHKVKSYKKIGSNESTLSADETDIDLLSHSQKTIVVEAKTDDFLNPKLKRESSTGDNRKSDTHEVAERGCKHLITDRVVQLLIECERKPRALESINLFDFFPISRENHKEPRTETCSVGVGTRGCDDVVRENSKKSELHDVNCVIQPKTDASLPMTAYNDSMVPITMGYHVQPHLLRSVLKRSGQKSKGHRVSINEANNVILESDYVILTNGETEHRLVSLEKYKNCPNNAGAELETLSPPDGYKDLHKFEEAVNEFFDESDPLYEAWKAKVHDPDCPRAQILLETSQKNLTKENLRYHEDFLVNGVYQESENGSRSYSKPTGILKGGKLWRNGGESKKYFDQVNREREEPRRSVRFSGQDEFNTLQEHEKQQSASQIILQQLHCLNTIMDSDYEDWLPDMSPTEINNEINKLSDVVDARLPLEPLQYYAQNNYDDFYLDDDQIKESIKRYEEMRKRQVNSHNSKDNSCSDESESSSNSLLTASSSSRSSIENRNLATPNGGVLRSNNEVRMAIQRNALRRSLMRYVDAKRKDTNNRNDKIKEKKEGTSLEEKLKWLTTSDSLDENNETQNDGNEESLPNSTENPDDKETYPAVNSLDRYRKLANMFNKFHKHAKFDYKVPKDVRDWKIESEMYPDKCGMDCIDSISTDTHTYTAIPVVTICDETNDSDTVLVKPLYSGGVRYTKEGTLPPNGNSSNNETNRGSSNYETRNSKQNTASGLYEFIDEAEHSNSIPSSQSSPRLSGVSDDNGTTTTESGYSSNETNVEVNSGSIPPAELNELAEFVKNEAKRMNRLRKRYDDPEDHGFNRRPSVRGIKTRFGSTSDLIKEMTNQLAPPTTKLPGKHRNLNQRQNYYDDSSLYNDRVNSHQKLFRNASNIPSAVDDMHYTMQKQHPIAHLPPQRTVSYSCIPISGALTGKLFGNIKGGEESGSSQRSSSIQSNKFVQNMDKFYPVDQILSLPSENPRNGMNNLDNVSQRISQNFKDNSYLYRNQDISNYPSHRDEVYQRSYKDDISPKDDNNTQFPEFQDNSYTPVQQREPEDYYDEVADYSNFQFSKKVNSSQYPDKNSLRREERVSTNQGSRSRRPGAEEAQTSNFMGYSHSDFNRSSKRLHSNEKGQFYRNQPMNVIT